MKKKIWQRLAVAALLGLCTWSAWLPQTAWAEAVPVKVINYGGKARLPEYLHLQTTEAPGYNQYTNGRFGFTAYIPAEMDGCFLPHNGDGASFLNGEGAGIVVSGMHNVINHTIESEYQEALEAHPDAAYKERGRDWFVISYFNELKGIIVYEKHFVNERYLNTLRFSYPREDQEYYGPMLEVLEENFVPGWKTGNKIMG